jgi:Ser-tRNA(Ala) deacylase AlaX
MECFKFFDLILWHHNCVVKLMSLLEIHREKLPFEIPEGELFKRAVLHDLDKLQEIIESVRVGKPGEAPQEVLARVDFKKHHEINSHHTTCHIIGKTKPSNVDICEMVCDWVASSYKSYNKDVEKNKNYWEVIYTDKYPDTKDFIGKNEPEKFKTVSDLISSFGLSDDFFGEDPKKKNIK